MSASEKRRQKTQTTRVVAGIRRKRDVEKLGRRIPGAGTSRKLLVVFALDHQRLGIVERFTDVSASANHVTALRRDKDERRVALLRCAQGLTAAENGM